MAPQKKNVWKCLEFLGSLMLYINLTSFNLSTKKLVIFHTEIMTLFCGLFFLVKKHHINLTFREKEIRSEVSSCPLRERRESEN